MPRDEARHFVMDVRLLEQQFHAYTLGGFTGASKPVVTLGVMDMNHDGKPDLLVSVEGTAIQTVLFNTGDSFRMGG